jgi:hypothetical protein
VPAAAAIVTPPVAAPPPPPPTPPTQPGPVTPTAVKPEPGPVRPTVPAGTGTAPTTGDPVGRTPDGTDPGIIARKPQDTVPGPKGGGKPVATVSQREAQPGDRICGACAEPNDPTRKFCRRCGANLSEARVVEVVKLPWYRRIVGGPKQPKQYAAGERIDSMAKGSAKKPREGIRGILTGISKGEAAIGGVLALTVMLGIGYVAVPSLQVTINQVIGGGPTKIFDNVRKAIAPQPAVVLPTSIVASSELEDHPASNLWDKKLGTDWRSDEALPTLEVEFKEPIDLMFLLINIGPQKDFVDYRRPSKIEVVFPDGTSKVLTLEDKPELQSFEMGVNGIDKLTIKILDSNDQEMEAPISISEIQFNKKT